MAGYIFGGDTGLSYQDMVRQRERAQQMQQQAAQAEGPGAGFNILANGFAAHILNKRANAAETKGREGAETAFQNATGGGALAQLFQQGLAGPTQVQSQPSGVAGAFEGAAASSGQFPASLIQSESGGNWSALNSEGYGGRLQFGKDRLADAARAGVIPAGMTGAQFSQLPPEQQQAVESWHFADIDQQAQRMGLDKFVGQNVGGVNVTQDAIRGMAHLGGIGGAAKFLQSGGQYNPADSNGTSLRDYGQRHGGGQGGQAARQPAAMGGANVPAVMEALANPYLNDGQRSVLSMILQDSIQQRNAAQAAEMAARKPVNLTTFTGPDGAVYSFNPSTGEKSALTDPKDPSLAGNSAEVQALKWRAEQAGLQPGTPEYEAFMLSGGRPDGEVPAAFRALHLQALAAGLDEGSPEYKSFMATRGAGLAAEARATGAAAGQAQASAEGDYETAQNALDLIDSIRNDPNRSRGTGKSAIFNGIPGTAGYDFQQKVEQAKGGAFLTAIQTMKGLGALSNNEGAAATQAVTRMNTASTEAGFLEALDDYEKIVRQGQERAQRNGGGPALAAPIAAKAAAYPNADQFGFGGGAPAEQSDDDYLKSLGLE